MHIKFEKKNKNEATRTTVTFLEAEMNRIDSVKWFSKEIPILFQIVNAELQICFICQIKAWKKNGLHTIRVVFWFSY